MNNFLKTSLSFLVSAGLVCLASKSQADVTLKVDTGFAIPLTKPQSDRFDVGGGVMVKGLYGLTSYVDVGPSVAVLALPASYPYSETGTVLGLGAGARVKRPHDESNKGTGFKAVSPWVDADVQYVRTGELDRAGLALAVGASVPTSDARTLWMGPFVRYQNVGTFRGDEYRTDTRSANTLVLGLSLEFAPAKSNKSSEEEDNDFDRDGVLNADDHCPYVPGPKDNHGCPKKDDNSKATDLKFELRQKVQFAWDSFVIEETEFKALSEVVTALLEKQDYKVRIEGHASSEGNRQHNDTLSQDRANAVLEYLVAHGVSKDRLVAVGFGSAVPVADNDTQVGRVANRRVEFAVKFIVSGKGGSK